MVQVLENVVRISIPYSRCGAISNPKAKTRVSVIVLLYRSLVHILVCGGVVQLVVQNSNIFKNNLGK